MPVIQPYFNPDYIPGPPVFVTFYKSLLEQRQASKMMQMELLLREADTGYIDDQIAISNENIRELQKIKFNILEAREKGKQEFGHEMMKIFVQEQAGIIKATVNANARIGGDWAKASASYLASGSGTEEFAELQRRNETVRDGLSATEQSDIRTAVSGATTLTDPSSTDQSRIGFINSNILKDAKEAAGYGTRRLSDLEERMLYVGIAEFAANEATKASISDSAKYNALASSALIKANMAPDGSQYGNMTNPTPASVTNELRTQFVPNNQVLLETLNTLARGEAVEGVSARGVGAPKLNIPQSYKDWAKEYSPELAKDLGIESEAEVQTSSAIKDLETQIGRERLKLGTLERRRMAEAQKTADRFKQASKVMERSLFAPSFTAPAPGQAFLDQLATIKPAPVPTVQPEEPKRSQTYTNLELGKMYNSKVNPDISVGLDMDDRPVFSMYGQMYAPTTEQENSSVGMLLQGMNEEIEQILKQAQQSVE